MITEFENYWKENSCKLGLMKLCGRLATSILKPQGDTQNIIQSLVPLCGPPSGGWGREEGKGRGWGMTERRGAEHQLTNREQNHITTLDQWTPRHSDKTDGHKQDAKSLLRNLKKSKETPLKKSRYITLRLQEAAKGTSITLPKRINYNILKKLKSKQYPPKSYTTDLLG